MTRLTLIASFAALSLAAGPLAAAPCKDAKGKFIKCPPAKPAPAGRCMNSATKKFARCGTPGAVPMKGK